MPECMAFSSVLTLTTTFVSPRRLVVSVGTPTAKLPVSATRIASALKQLGVGRDEPLETARALLLGALGDELDSHREIRLPRRAVR